MAHERTESQGFYEMLWDCEHCGTKGLLGKSQRHCAECGAPQNPDKRYFPSDEQKQAVDGHRYEGADRHCPACNTAMGASANNCTKCGSPLDGSKEVKGVAAPVAPRPAKKKIWPYVVAGIVLFIVLIWYVFLRTKEATLTVTAHRWERAIVVEKYGDWQDEAWRDQVPAGASMPLCHRKQRSTKKVEDGEDCRMEKVDKKDGTFEEVKKCRPKYREEPVEDDWCKFQIRRWQKVDELKASGTGMTAAWPAGAPPDSSPETIGALRSGPRTETLHLDFGKAGDCKVSEPTWRKFADGQSVKLEVRARSGAVVCSSL